MMSILRARLGTRALLLIAMLAAIVATAIPATADPVPRPPPAPKAPATADQIFARLIDADQRVTDAKIRLQEAEQSSAAAARRARLSRAEADAAAKAFRAADGALAHQMALWQQLTARAYIGGSAADATQLDELLRGEISDQTGQAVVMFGQVVNGRLDRIRAAREVRSAALTRMRLTAARAPKTQDTASDRARLRVVARDRLRTVLAYRERVRTSLRQAAAREAVFRQAAARTAALGLLAFQQQPQVSLATPLLGLPRLDPEDLSLWFKANHHHARTKVPVEFLAAWFIDEGRQEGVRGDIAFAQAVLETGGFTNIDSVTVNNYAGIGHCDTCPRGFAFKTPLLGVRAQIQLLKSYAVKEPTYANPLVDPRLHGPAGCCPTWGDLTRTWATAPTYGPSVMAIYTDLMEFALRRHAAVLPQG